MSLYRVTVYPRRGGTRAAEVRAPCSVSALIRGLQKCYPEEGPADGLTVYVRPAPEPEQDHRRDSAPSRSGTATQEEVGC